MYLQTNQPARSQTTESHRQPRSTTWSLLSLQTSLRQLRPPRHHSWEVRLLHPLHPCHRLFLKSLAAAVEKKIARPSNPQALQGHRRLCSPIRFPRPTRLTFPTTRPVRRLPLRTLPPLYNFPTTQDLLTKSQILQSVDNLPRLLLSPLTVALVFSLVIPQLEQVMITQTPVLSFLPMSLPARCHLFSTALPIQLLCLPPTKHHREITPLL